MDLRRSAEEAEDEELQKTYVYQEICIGPIECLKPDARRQCLLMLESFVKILTEVWLHAQGLQDENAHPHNSLLRSV